MEVTPGKINFGHAGIGTVLISKRLAVPVNQREYSWKKEHVLDLFQDLSDSIGANKSIYFLGTIVLTISKNTGILEVTDGQQRLATTTILLAAIRDYLMTRADAEYVIKSLDRFLYDEDRNLNMPVPRLTLNVDDDEFFRSRILPPPQVSVRKKSRPSKPSHERVATAATEAAAHVQSIIGEYSDKSRVSALNRWIDFIQHSAEVIILTVPDDVNAYVMFETLNDRGVKTTQADMMKNYLFGEAGDRKSEAQQRWSAMKGAIESGDTDDVVVTYLRHFLVVRHGATRDKEVYAKIKGSVRGPHSTIKFLDELLELAHHYAALSNNRHSHWQSLGNHASKVRRHIDTLIDLNVEQIKPLMLACMKRFTSIEISRSFRLFISWIVRFMVGGTPTGTVE